MACPMPRAPLTVEQRRLVEKNTAYVRSLVHSLMRRMPKARSYEEDIFHYGVLGLMRAAQGFDPSHGFAFLTYADRWIRNGINHGVISCFQVRAPRKASGQLAGEPMTCAGDAPLSRVLAEDAEVEDALDGHHLASMAREELLRRMDGRGGAERRVDSFLRGLMEGVTNQADADTFGVSRQRVEQLRADVRQHFNAWAAELRAEAA